MFLKIISLSSFIFVLSLQAQSLKDLKSYEAHFTQTIVDQDDIKVVYTGIFKARKPLQALWVYKTPIEKKLYINNHQIILVEPELEQAIYRQSEETFTLFNLLEGANKLSNTRYEKMINGQTYRLDIQDDIIKTITYKDDFENDVSIVFSKQKPNSHLKAKDFHPIIPEDFDILHE